MSKFSNKELIELGKSVHSWLMLNEKHDLYIDNDENQDNIHHYACGWNACRADLLETLFSDLHRDEDESEYDV